MTLITTILSLFGSTLGGVASWLWGLFQTHEQAVTQASADMTNAISQHASDGAQSVADVNSIDQQLANVQAQQDALNAQSPVEVKP